MAIGNGYLSEYLQDNSEIALQYGHGFNGVEPDAYNVYQDCYLTPISPFGRASQKIAGRRRAVLQRRRTALAGLTASAQQPLFNNNGDNSWYGSTDAFHGFACFNDDNMQTYLNRPDVMTALHAKLVHRSQVDGLQVIAV
ncbi:hypothetical protein COOONC_21494 [Cooperia oncophora]